jgi:regulator of sigma E protease
MPAFLQNVAFTVLPFVLLITVIVTVHEFGHFLVARWFGVAVDRFAIGFGRSLVSWKDRAGVEWRVGWLPLGGYVKFSGDENAASVPDKNDLESLRASIIAREGPGAERRYLHFKPLWQRSLIILAGPAANFLLAILTFATCIGVFGQATTTARVARVEPGSAAAAAGIQPGDLILGADGRFIRDFEDLRVYVQFRAGVPIDFLVDRGGRDIHLLARPRPVQEPSPFGGAATVGRLGLGPVEREIRHYGPIEAVGLGAAQTWEVTTSTAFYLGRMVTGQMSADQLGGVIGMAHASGEITKQVVTEAKEAGVNWVVAESQFLLQFIGLISVSVGLFNLLPIPVLDGGHLLFHAYEWVTRKPPSVVLQAAGYRVGLALLVGLMLFAAWNDLQRLRVFHSFGSLFS